MCPTGGGSFVSEAYPVAQFNDKNEVGNKAMAWEGVEEIIGLKNHLFMTSLILFFSILLLFGNAVNAILPIRKKIQTDNGKPTKIGWIVIILTLIVCGIQVVLVLNESTKLKKEAHQAKLAQDTATIRFKNLRDSIKTESKKTTKIKELTSKIDVSTEKINEVVGNTLSNLLTTQKELELISGNLHRTSDKLGSTKSKLDAVDSQLSIFQNNVSSNAKEMAVLTKRMELNQFVKDILAVPYKNYTLTIVIEFPDYKIQDSTQFNNLISEGDKMTIRWADIRSITESNERSQTEGNYLVSTMNKPTQNNFTKFNKYRKQHFTLDNEIAKIGAEVTTNKIEYKNFWFYRSACRYSSERTIIVRIS
jgi:hypothetical protein